MKILTNKETLKLGQQLAYRIYKDDHRYPLNVYAVPRGGVPVSYLIMIYLHDCNLVETPEEADIIVDDIIDTGKTKHRYDKYNKPFYALLEHQTEWILFSWENKDKGTPIDDNLIRIIKYLEDNKDEKVLVQLQKIIDET